MTRIHEMRYLDSLRRQEEWEFNRSRDEGAGVRDWAAPRDRRRGERLTPAPVRIGYLDDPAREKWREQLWAEMEARKAADDERLYLDYIRAIHRNRAMGLYEKCPKCGHYTYICKRTNCRRMM